MTKLLFTFLLLMSLCADETFAAEFDLSKSLRFEVKGGDISHRKNFSFDYPTTEKLQEIVHHGIKQKKREFTHFFEMGSTIIEGEIHTVNYNSKIFRAFTKTPPSLHSISLLNCGKILSFTYNVWVEAYEEESRVFINYKLPKEYARWRFDTENTIDFKQNAGNPTWYMDDHNNRVLPDVTALFKRYSTTTPYSTHRRPI